MSHVKHGKTRHLCEKDYIWNPAKCRCENERNSASIMTDSAITCDEVKGAEAKSNNEESKTIPTNLNEKIYITCEIENFGSAMIISKKASEYTSLAFLLIIIALPIALSIYCYLIKFIAEPKHLLPFHDTN